MGFSFFCSIHREHTYRHIQFPFRRNPIQSNPNNAESLSAQKESRIQVERLKDYLVLLVACSSTGSTGKTRLILTLEESKEERTKEEKRKEKKIQEVQKRIEACVQSL